MNILCDASEDGKSAFSPGHAPYADKLNLLLTKCSLANGYVSIFWNVS